jgi:hypothetical protein
VDVWLLRREPEQECLGGSGGGVWYDFRGDDDCAVDWVQLRKSPSCPSLHSMQVVILLTSPSDHRLLPPPARQLLRDDDHRALRHCLRLDLLHLRLGDLRGPRAALWDLRHDHGHLWAVGCAALCGREEDADCYCKIFAGEELNGLVDVGYVFFGGISSRDIREYVSPREPHVRVQYSHRRGVIISILSPEVAPVRSIGA